MIHRSAIVRAAAAAGLALAAFGTASLAHARSDVVFSIGANIAPGVTLGVSSAPSYSYYGPTYYQPAPVYYQPAPVYYQPAPVYYRSAPVYYQPAPVYYEPAAYVAPRVVYARPYGYGYHRGHHGYGYRY